MGRIVGLLSLSVALVLALASVREPTIVESEYVQGRIVLRFKPAAMPSKESVSLNGARFGIPEVDAAISRHRGSMLTKYLPTYDAYSSGPGDRLERSFVLDYDDGTDPQVLAVEISKIHVVEEAMPIKKVAIAYYGVARHIPAQLLFSRQWSLDTLGVAGDRIDIDAPEAWAIERGDPDIVIGITDTGCMIDTFVAEGPGTWRLHSAFRYYLNPAEDGPPFGEVQGSEIDNVDNSYGADGDTLRDNIMGYNFSPEPKPGICTPRWREYWRAMPHNGTLSSLNDTTLAGHNPHGLNVASIAASNGEFVGIAHNCMIYPVRMPHGGSGEPSSIALGDPTPYQLAMTEAASKSDVVNMSWGFINDPGEPFHDAVQFATDWDQGFDCVLVAATGNISDHPSHLILVSWPARYPEVLGVGNMGKDGEWYEDSEYGPLIGYVDVVAPTGTGVPVVTQKLCGEEPSDPVINGDCPKRETVRYNFNGTSAASPHAAGIAALVRSRFPSLNNVAVRERIIGSAQWYWPQTHEDSLKVGRGKVNAYRALTEWGPITGDVTWSTSATGNALCSRDGIFHVSGDITIEDGGSLTIDAGVVVKIAPDHERTESDTTRVEIIVKDGGVLNIQGTAEDPVVIESFTDSAPTRTDWVGVRFEEGWSTS